MQLPEEMPNDLEDEIINKSNPYIMAHLQAIRHAYSIMKDYFNNLSVDWRPIDELTTTEIAINDAFLLIDKREILNNRFFTGVPVKLYDNRKLSDVLIVNGFYFKLRSIHNEFSHFALLTPPKS